eukprot:2994764-Pleurochrysis_carterae.AAC.1
MRLVRRVNGRTAEKPDRKHGTTVRCGLPQEQARAVQILGPHAAVHQRVEQILSDVLACIWAKCAQITQVPVGVW